MKARRGRTCTMLWDRLDSSFMSLDACKHKGALRPPGIPRASTMRTLFFYTGNSCRGLRQVLLVRVPGSFGLVSTLPSETEVKQPLMVFFVLYVFQSRCFTGDMKDMWKAILSLREYRGNGLGTPKKDSKNSGILRPKWSRRIFAILVSDETNLMSGVVFGRRTVSVTQNCALNSERTNSSDRTTSSDKWTPVSWSMCLTMSDGSCANRAHLPSAVLTWSSYSDYIPPMFLRFPVWGPHWGLFRIWAIKEC